MPITSKDSFVFVGGAARSGTTLCQAAICGIPGFGPFLPESAQLPILAEAANKIARHNGRFDLAFWKDNSEVALFGQMLEPLLARVRKGHKASVPVLKHPASTPLIPRLVEAFGDRVSVVVMVRDPRDTIASMVSWGLRASEQGREIWFAQRNMRALCRYFLSFYGPVLAMPDQGNVTFVRYEDLVNDPEGSAGKLLPGLNGAEKGALDWGKVDLSPEGPVGLASSSFYGKPASNERIGRYSDQLFPHEIRIIEGCCAAFMTRFGYEGAKDLDPDLQIDIAGLADVVAPLVPAGSASDQETPAEEVAPETAELASLRAQLAELRAQMTDARLNEKRARNDYTVKNVELLANLTDKLEAHQDALARMSQQKEAMAEKLDAQQEAVARMSQQKDAMAEKLEAQQEAVNRMAQQRNALIEDVAFQKEALARIVQQKDSFAEKLETQQEAVNRVAQQRTALIADVASQREALARIVQQKDAISEKLEAQQEAVARITQQRAAMAEKLEAQQEAVARITQQRAAMAEKLEAQQEAVNRMAQQRNAMTADVANQKEALARLAQQKLALTEKLEAQQEAVNRLAQQRNALAEDLASQKEALARLAQQKLALTEKLEAQAEAQVRSNQQKAAMADKLETQQDALGRLAQQKVAMAQKLESQQDALSRLSQQKAVMAEKVESQKGALDRFAQQKVAFSEMVDKLMVRDPWLLQELARLGAMQEGKGAATSTEGPASKADGVDP